jgi:hypothetical protein
LFWRKYRQFCRFAVRVSMQAPGSWLYKMSVARIVLRKIGIYEIVHRRSSEQQVILLDNEGVLQASHTLFVHSRVRLSSIDLSSFVSLASLPDVVVYLRQPHAVLLERTLARGHNRLSDHSYATVDSFVKQAVEMFDELQRHPALASRLLVINGEQKTLAPRAPLDDSRLAMASKIIAASLDDTAIDNTLASGHNE